MTRAQVNTAFAHTQRMTRHAQMSYSPIKLGF
jgi:hypothetical protein